MSSFQKVKSQPQCQKNSFKSSSLAKFLGHIYLCKLFKRLGKILGAHFWYYMRISYENFVWNWRWKSSVFLHLSSSFFLLRHLFTTEQHSRNPLNSVLQWCLDYHIPLVERKDVSFILTIFLKELLEQMIPHLKALI